MGQIRKKCYKDFRKNAVKLSCASPKAVREIAEDQEFMRICFSFDYRLKKHLGFKIFE